MTTPTAPETAWQEKTAGRPAGRRPAQLWQVPTFFAGLLAFLVATAGSAFRSVPASRQLERDFTALRQGFKDKAPPAALLELAENAVKRADNHPEKAAEAHFLLGMVCVRLAEQGPADRANDERKRAHQHFDLAEAKGVPADDLPRLQYQLGKLLYESGGELPRVIEYLARSVATGADDPAEGYALLARAYLRLRPPDLNAALAANQKQIDHTDDEAVLAPARLQRADLLLRKDQRGEAIKVLKQIGSAAPAPARLKARYLQAQCCQEEGQWGQAVPLWQELLAEPTAVPGGKAHILYSQGLCYARAEPREEAKAGAAWQQAARLGGPDSQAAALRLAELYLHGKESATALDWFRRALEKVPSARDYQNSLVGLDQVRELFETGCRVYREGQDAEHARELAELYKRLALPGVAEERLAEATEGQAAALLKKAQTMDPGPQAATVEEKARALYREAGAAYELAAEGRVPLEKALRLRHSADCYSHAAEYARAVAVLRRFVELDPPPAQKAEGWFALATAYRALRQPEEATKAYYECIQYPKNPLGQRARLELAELEARQGNPVKAEAILLHSLALAGPGGDRQTEEQALYKLGELLFQQGNKFDEARIRLGEAVRKYPGNAGVLWARDRLGACHRRLGEQAKRDSAAADLPGEKRRIYLGAMREHFEQARDVYQKLADDLEKTSAARKLDAAEEGLLRKALFIVAECSFDLPNGFPEALRLYQGLAQRFRGRVDGLMACQGLINCCLLAGDTEQSRVARRATQLALEAARADLPRMPAEEFRRSGNTLSRERWARSLSEQSDWLATFPQMPTPRRNP